MSQSRPSTVALQVAVETLVRSTEAALLDPKDADLALAVQAARDEVKRLADSACQPADLVDEGFLIVGGAKATSAVPTVAIFRSAPSTVVRSAAVGVRAVAGRPTRAPREVVGILPPAASSTGRLYYAFLKRHPQSPCIVAGQSLCLGLLGGSWKNFVPAPEGFATIESAGNAVLEAHPGISTIPLVVK